MFGCSVDDVCCGVWLSWLIVFVEVFGCVVWFAGCLWWVGVDVGWLV